MYAGSVIPVVTTTTPVRTLQAGPELDAELTAAIQKWCHREHLMRTWGCSPLEMVNAFVEGWELEKALGGVLRGGLPVAAPPKGNK